MPRPPKALLEEWNQKLKLSGFQDIEQLRGSEYVLKPDSGTVVRAKRSRCEVIEAKAHYYQLIGQRLEETTFKSPGEIFTMYLHCEGLSNRTIAKKLGPVQKTQMRKVVGRCIKKWLKAWGLR